MAGRARSSSRGRSSRSRTPTPRGHRTGHGRAASTSPPASSTTSRTRSRSSSASRSDIVDRVKDSSTLKTTLIFLGAIAATTFCAHKYWPAGVTYGGKEPWEIEEHHEVHRRRRARSPERHRDLPYYSRPRSLSPPQHPARRRPYTLSDYDKELRGVPRGVYVSEAREELHDYRHGQSRGVGTRAYPVGIERTRYSSRRPRPDPRSRFGEIVDVESVESEEVVRPPQDHRRNMLMLPPPPIGSPSSSKGFVVPLSPESVSVRMSSRGGASSSYRRDDVGSVSTSSRGYMREESEESDAAFFSRRRGSSSLGPLDSRVVQERQPPPPPPPPSQQAQNQPQRYHSRREVAGWRKASSQGYPASESRRRREESEIDASSDSDNPSLADEAPLPRPRRDPSQHREARRMWEETAVVRREARLVAQRGGWRGDQDDDEDSIPPAPPSPPPAWHGELADRRTRRRADREAAGTGRSYR